MDFVLLVKILKGLSVFAHCLFPTISMQIWSKTVQQNSNVEPKCATFNSENVLLKMIKMVLWTFNPSKVSAFNLQYYSSPDWFPKITKVLTFFFQTLKQRRMKVETNLRPKKMMGTLRTRLSTQVFTMFSTCILLRCSIFFLQWYCWLILVRQYR